MFQTKVAEKIKRTYYRIEQLVFRKLCLLWDCLLTPWIRVLLEKL